MHNLCIAGFLGEKILIFVYFEQKHERLKKKS
ncbi:hypothetical protein CLCHR_11150 [Clostridium chromiireducens]|uniref:Uncharacterized protein n=1 Tax=Clostridium chromiireducens TaxID=225345 RepID=A0A1V4IXG9_9CLOT|nr:hypothetical protein CLCHR_11150 [Clostridium chromiireducens]